ncbi:SET and MYND domain-containing protein 4 [Anabrus simplex]|uniref:SET and MYND domain-containing protein 4 n=1 Tax=Anabrus simplex TaxID=316456 RepID=UPI0035A3CA32
MNEEDPDPFYTSLCSSVTLQSNKQGFFLAYAEHVLETLGTKWLNNVFAKLKTDEERIRACYSSPKVYEAVHGTLQHIQELYRQKSAAVSRQKRLEARRELDAGRLQQALVLSSQSIIRAPTKGVDKTVDDGLSLPLGLAARSEVLLELREYELCIADIQLAMKEGFPEQRRFQLYWRMGRCYRNMGQVAKARVSFQVALKIIAQYQVEIGKDSTSYAITLNQELSNISASEEIKEPYKDPQKADPVLPEVTGVSNPELPAASSRVKIESSEGAGRFAVASTTIKSGDTIVVEGPYAACLLTEYFGSHCHHCFKRVKAPVACPDCSSLAFCSPACRDEACASYHKYECHYMDMLIGSGMSILCHVALRMVTQSGLEHFLKIKDSLATTGKTPSRDSYSAVYNLVTHSDKRPAEDFLHRTLMAIFLLKILKSSKFFKTTSDNQTSLTDEETFIGSLLLRHLQLLQFNAHEIFETKMEAPGKFRGARTLYIGVGIYPTVALFNHDCYPAVSRYFVGKSIVIRALRPLEQGQVVAENYGPIFVKRPRAARQRTLLSRYWFHCDCQACREEWPMFENQTNSSFRLKCTTAGCKQLLPIPHQNPPKGKQKPTLMVKCRSCKKQISVEEQLAIMKECEEDYARGLDAMDEGDTTTAIPLFSSYIDRMHAIGSPPHKDLHLCQEALRICMADSGNKWITSGSVQR